MEASFLSILPSVIGGVFTILTAIAVILVNKYVQDQQAASTIDAAIKDALGAIQQATQTGLKTVNPEVAALGLDPHTAIGVQHVLQHAAPEMNRLGVSAIDVASVLSAKLGLLNIESNLATAASPSPTPTPLAPVRPPEVPTAPVVGLTRPAVVDPNWKP